MTKRRGGAYGCMKIGDTPLVLLAKPDETILEHTENALSVFKSIRESFPHIAQLCGVDDFWEHLFLSIFFHDFGKAATGFQKMLKYGKKWGYRHEILSAGFVSSLEYSNPLYKDAVGLTIITHHKDIMELRSRYNTYPSPVGKIEYENRLSELEENFYEISDYFDHLPKMSKKYLGYSLSLSPPNSINDLTDTYKEIVLEYWNNYSDRNKTILHGKYGIFLKGLLNACDHLSSAKKRTILNAVEDMRQVFPFEELREIQEKSLKTKGNSFLTAPTGSGKTEAALFWSDANQNRIRSRRVFYLLPYTASINAMYQRLQSAFGRKDLVGLKHGKATYFLYKTFSEDHDYYTAREKAREISNLTKKIYRPYKVMTPFQLLKAFFGAKYFELQMSEMSNSLIILDEIHSYDAHTTALILEMLKILTKEYQSDIFIMSATLPSFIKEMFRQELDIHAEIFMDKSKLKEFTRHKINLIDGDILQHIDKIKEDIKDKKRLLVVCNTVSRAQEVFQFLSPGIKSALLHGKFVLKDRERIEGKLNNVDLLVGTQAIEVSLDIDYDVIYSEPAPIDALIQRFGRVNRKGWMKNIIVPVYVFTKGSDNDKYIYDSEIVKTTLDSLNGLNLLSEDIIQDIVDKIYSDGYTGKKREEFNQVVKHFKKFYEDVVPFIYKKEKMEEFYSLFKSYEVVPLQYKLDYLNEIENKKYLNALGYFTSISVGQFKKLEKENRIIQEQDTFFVNSEYNTELGILLAEEDNII